MVVFSVILGLLLICGGISLFATPLTTFMSAGYFVIILFLVYGVFGIIKAIADKQYGKKFFFSILSLILGILGFVIPGAATLNNFILLYLAAGWLLIRAILSFMDAYYAHKQGEGWGAVLLCVLLGILDVALCIYSVLHPEVLAITIGFLVGLYFIESGVHMIVVATALTSATTVLFTILGIFLIMGGFALAATPLSTYFSTGYYIIILFFVFGIVGVIRGFTEKRFDKEFFFAILSVILGVLGLVIPGLAEMNSFVMLYMVAGWLLVRGVLAIVHSIEIKKAGGDTGTMVLGIIMGVLDIILAIFSIAYPAVLAVALGILIAFLFIETGLNMIMFGVVTSQAEVLVEVD